MRLAIFGVGGMGRDLFTAARHTADAVGRDLVYVADEPREPLFEIPVISPTELTSDDQLVVALGCSKLRRQVAERLAHVQPGTVVASTAIIGHDVTIGEGSVFLDFTAVSASTRIGRHFQSNYFCHVAHDCLIGDFVTFAPRVTCNGHVRIEDGAYIGAGAVIRNGTYESPIVLGAGSVVGMGAVVTRSVRPHTTVVGIPAREVTA